MYAKSSGLELRDFTNSIEWVKLLDFTNSTEWVELLVYAKSSGVELRDFTNNIGWSYWCMVRVQGWSYETLLTV